MEQDRSCKNDSLSGFNCNWIIIAVVIFIIITCFCKDKKECIEPEYQNYIF